MRRAVIAALSALSGVLVAAPAAAETLLVGNKGENTLSVIALDSGAELARLPTGPMPHEIAVSPDGKQAAVVAYGGTTIDVFDVATRTKLRTIDLSPNRRPHGLLWLADGRLVATAEGSTSVAVVAPDGKLVATSNIASGTISLFDAETRVPLKTITVSGEAAKGQVTLLFSPDSKRLYAAETGHDKIAEIDVASGEVLRRIAAGKNGDGLAIAR